MKILISELRQKVISTFKERGFSDADANRMADVLLWADMSGVRPMGIAKMVGSEPVQDEKAVAPDPELLVDSKDFKAQCSDMVKTIQTSRKQNGVDEIRLPGERARAAYKQSQKTGMVDVDEVVLKELGYIE